MITVSTSYTKPSTQDGCFKTSASALLLWIIVTYMKFCNNCECIRELGSQGPAIVRCNSWTQWQIMKWTQWIFSEWIFWGNLLLISNISHCVLASAVILAVLVYIRTVQFPFFRNLGLTLFTRGDSLNLINSVDTSGKLFQVF